MSREPTPRRSLQSPAAWIRHGLRGVIAFVGWVAARDRLPEVPPAPPQRAGQPGSKGWFHWLMAGQELPQTSERIRRTRMGFMDTFLKPEKLPDNRADGRAEPQPGLLRHVFARESLDRMDGASPVKETNDGRR